MLNPPVHVTVTDHTVRVVGAICYRCKARVDFGQYADPERIDQLLTEWVERHRHEGWS